MNVVVLCVFIALHPLRNEQASGRRQLVLSLPWGWASCLAASSVEKSKSKVLPRLAPLPRTQGWGRCLSVCRTVAVSESQFCTVFLPNAVKFKKSFLLFKERKGIHGQCLLGAEAKANHSESNSSGLEGSSRDPLF